MFGYVFGAVSALLVWLVLIELMFVEFGLLAASTLGMQKRPRFWVRVLLGYLVMLSLVVLVTEAIALRLLPSNLLMLLWLVLVVISLAFGPTLCYRRAAPSSGSSDAGGGGGSGPDRPPPPPTAPSGGIPLPDADQARRRARDHNRPRLHDLKRHRRAREPGRTPARSATC